MEKKKKYIKIIRILLCVVAVITLTIYAVNPSKLRGDSGFDSSYDSGSSYDSSSSYDSGSSYDSSSSYDRSYSSSSSSSSDDSPGIIGSFFGGILLIFMLISIVSLPFNIIAFIIDKIKSRVEEKRTNSIINKMPLYHSAEISDDEVKKIIPNFNKKEFINDRYNDFVIIQNAWMNFDYDTLRNMLTDELYNQYEMQLDTLKVKNEKNVMNGFEFKDAMITDIEKESEKVTLTLEIAVSFYDYITQNGRVVRGNKNVMINQHYKMTFVCNIDNYKASVCPNCGATLDNSASNICTYCGSVVTSLSNKWVLSKKSSICQR